MVAPFGRLQTVFDIPIVDDDAILRHITNQLTEAEKSWDTMLRWKSEALSPLRLTLSLISIEKK
jgi:hypothetical protein